MSYHSLGTKIWLTPKLNVTMQKQFHKIFIVLQNKIINQGKFTTW